MSDYSTDYLLRTIRIMQDQLKQYSENELISSGEYVRSHKEIDKLLDNAPEPFMPLIPNGEHE
jgi:hypothetical protein